jgi:putative FmdB family regulatory protein
MPIYEYRCERCGKTFEKRRNISEADRGIECPECASEEIERLLSAFATTGCGSGGGGRGRFT